MSNKEQLRAKLAAIKELKSEYFIGSYNAFYYLRALNQLEELLKTILGTRPEFKDRLTIKQLAWLLDYLPLLLGRKLKVLSCQTSTPNDWSCFSDHYVKPLLNNLKPNYFTWSKEQNDEAGIIGNYFWKINPQHVKNFCLFLDESCDWSNTTKISQALNRYLDESLEEGSLIIESEGTGKSITKKEFCLAPSCRTYSRDCPWDIVKINLNYGGDSEKDKPALREAIERRNAELAHSAIQKISLEEALLRIKGASHERSMKVASIDEWIYDQKLYKRSSEEYTLGQLAVERRIAINLAHLYQNEIPSIDLTAFVDALINKLEQRMYESKQRVHSFLSFGIRSLVELNEESVRKDRYFYLAVKQNRRWLIDFLAH